MSKVDMTGYARVISGVDMTGYARVISGVERQVVPAGPSVPKCSNVLLFGYICVLCFIHNLWFCFKRT